MASLEFGNLSPRQGSSCASLRMTFYYFNKQLFPKIINSPFPFNDDDERTDNYFDEAGSSTDDYSGEAGDDQIGDSPGLHNGRGLEIFDKDNKKDRRNYSIGDYNTLPYLIHLLASRPDMGYRPVMPPR